MYRYVCVCVCIHKILLLDYVWPLVIFVFPVFPPIFFLLPVSSFWGTLLSPPYMVLLKPLSQISGKYPISLGL